MYAVTDNGNVHNLESDEVVWDKRVGFYMVRRYGYVIFLKPRFRKKLYALPLVCLVKLKNKFAEFSEDWIE